MNENKGKNRNRNRGATGASTSNINQQGQNSQNENSQSLEAETSSNAASNQYIPHRIWSARQEIAQNRSTVLNYGLFLQAFCNSCKEMYSDTNRPYIQKCGISICDKCNIKKTNCDICRDEKENETNRKTVWNKDLLNNRSLILSEFKNIRFSEETDVSIIQNINVGDELLRRIIGFGNIRTIVSVGGDRSLLVKKKLLNENFACSVKMCRILQEMRLILETIKSKTMISNYLKESFKEVQPFENDLGRIDNSIYHILGKITSTNDVHIGLRIKDFKPNATCQSLSLNYYAISEKEETKYYPLKFYISSFYVGSCVKILELGSANCLIVDYESIERNHKKLGAYFQLKFESQISRVHLEVCPTSKLLKKQILRLSTGEEGPCYKGGTGQVVNQEILFETYKDGDLYRSDNIISNMPDEWNESMPESFKGMATIDKRHKKGACIRVLLNDKETNTESMENSIFIGKVLDIESLNCIPIGKFTIIDCGLLFDFETK